MLSYFVFVRNVVISMKTTSFQIDPIYFAAILLGLLLLLIIRKSYSQGRSPSLSFSLLHELTDFSNAGRSRWMWLPKALYQGALLFFALALIDPHFQTTSPNPKFDRTIPNKGIGIYLVLDQSGSMAEKTSRNTDSKMETMKTITEKFVRQRPNDLIGLVTFARTAQVLSPLTLDHKAIEQQIASLDVVKNPADDGTALGYAIYKTAHLIGATKRYAKKETGYDIKGAIMIVVTDGFQDPNPLDQGNRLRTIDLEEATDFAKSEGVKMYIVNVDPKIASQEMAPQRRLLKQYAEETGGKFYYVVSGNDLEEIYHDIDQLEKGDWATVKPATSTYRQFSFYPFLIALGLLSLLAGWVSETTWLRRTP